MTGTSDSTGLSGRTVIVTRAAERAGGLTELLKDAGAHVVEIPVTTTVDAIDGGEGLRRALDDISLYDWVVVTSPEGAHRLRDELSRRTTVDSHFKVAAVGTATAAAVGRADLVPNVQTGRSLGEAFPLGSGRVLLAVAESAGVDFETTARAKGWTVDRVISYRTVSIPSTVDRSDEIHKADAVTFASASSVRAWIEAFGRTFPEVVVAMGPTTAAVLDAFGVSGVVVAKEQSLQGLVAATASALASR